ncbi:DUF547 domain-containing protein [Halapricum salinum]|uniref:DUF547 domain-containing protein n=1 Tax=Halapricum salinum TaxID=1457250 RepID=A0A4D6HC89_9EURY|nr:DUF547 domain-containing protein [Halapricum salinum]QCC51215.1 DUF547 domain-containing protein [Halapricum salinum]
MDVEPVAVARELLGAVRDGDPTREYEDALAELDADALARALHSDERRLAFWLNVYNAYAQLLLDRWPGEYERSRRRFFGHEAIPVAGTWLSLDDVEHGILRGSQSSLGLGYLPRLMPSRFERRHRVEARDWRIHFALNCGARSCPPIRVYEVERIDAQLDLATASYLEQEVEYDSERGVARVPRLMLWYRGDFGGGSEIREILQEFGCVPEGESFRVRYQGYDWSREPGTFVD